MYFFNYILHFIFTTHQSTFARLLPIAPRFHSGALGASTSCLHTHTHTKAFALLTIIMAPSWRSPRRRPRSSTTSTIRTLSLAHRATWLECAGWTPRMRSSTISAVASTSRRWAMVGVHTQCVQGRASPFACIYAYTCAMCVSTVCFTNVFAVARIALGCVYHIGAIRLVFEMITLEDKGDWRCQGEANDLEKSFLMIINGECTLNMLLICIYLLV